MSCTQLPSGVGNSPEQTLLDRSARLHGPVHQRQNHSDAVQLPENEPVKTPAEQQTTRTVNLELHHSVDVRSQADPLQRIGLSQFGSYENRFDVKK